jgi:two-component system sensor kinase FixL
MSDARIAQPSMVMRPLPWMVVLGYFVVFLLLDWASFIRPVHDLNITPWNPQPGKQP